MDLSMIKYDVTYIWSNYTDLTNRPKTPISVAEVQSIPWLFQGNRSVGEIL